MSQTPAQRHYERRRPRQTPPHVSLRDLRAAKGLTLDDVRARIAEEHPGMTVTRGALSAIESGTRGVSPVMLDALCSAYGLPSGAITTDYQPRMGHPTQPTEVPA